MACEKDGNTVGAAIESERLAHLRLQIKSLGFDH
jgi:hypothetical protein